MSLINWLFANTSFAPVVIIGALASTAAAEPPSSSSPPAARPALAIDAGGEAQRGAVRKVGRLDAPEIRESSGLVASRRHPGVLYTHNDSGGAPLLFAVRADGTLLRQYRVPARHTDWEDIATDDAGHLYIANTGNNDAKRDAVEVIRVAEPDPAARAGSRRRATKHDDSRKDEVRLRVERTWRLTFPAGPFNCESLFIRGGHGYLVSKVDVGERAAIYRFAIDGPSTQAKLEKVTDLPIRRPVTGADVSADGRRLALVCSGVGATLYVFDIHGDITAAGGVEPRRVALPQAKIESVAFTTKDGILMTAESREIFRYDE